MSNRLSPLILRLFGPFEVQVNGPSPLRLRSRKSQWLLALLALRSGMAIERSWLAGLLWPESGEPQALHSLRMCLTDLRQALGEAASRLRSPTPQTLALDLTEAEVDVRAFDAAIARGDPASLEEAITLYRGPLLVGCGEAWVFQERQAREQAFLGALERLGTQAMGRGDPGAAERHLRVAVGVDPLRESAQRGLMEALAAAGGNYAAALVAYRELRLRLHRELNTEPDPQSQALFQRLRAEAHQGARGAPPNHWPVTPPPTRPAAFSPCPAAEESPVSPSHSADTQPTLAYGPRAGRSGQRVVLLYTRHMQPDEQLLKLLESQLTAHGFQVFVDRHVTIGMEWAREIERQVRTADAVVPLLSAALVPSEMLAYEVQIAHEAAEQQGGKPRLLPVRVACTDPLPELLAAVLDPIHHVLWEGPHDDQRLVAELLDALSTPPASRPTVSLATLEPMGGAVPLDSQFYVVRPTDEEFQAAVARQDSLVLVKGARQMGKTSLLARGLWQARKAGAKVVRMDFQKLTAADLASPETFFLLLATSVADQLGLEVLPDRVWNARRGPSLNFEHYLQREVLDRLETPVVWGLDEVDRLFTCPFGSEVFGLFRSWHNERAFDRESPWTRLTLAIAYATEVHLFITDVNQSPFNVGTRLMLEDFTLEQMADLNDRYGSPLRDEAEVARYYRLVSGQPYLVRRGLHEMATRGLEIGAVEARADRDEGIFGDHLRRMLVLLARDPDLCAVVREVLRGGPCPAAESFYRLRSAGVLAGNSAEDARPRCQLYATYLARHLR